MNSTINRRPLWVALTVILTALLLGLLQVTLAAAAPDEGDNRADVVVDLGNGSAVTRRVTFSETEISGLEALLSTGLQVTAVDFGWGVAVCAIEGVGCPASDCFCGGENYWGYHYWDGNAWQGYMVGANTSVVSDGAVEGWRWGPFGVTPPPVSAEVLAANAALQWIRSQQQADGGYGNAGATVDVVLAARAANQEPSTWQLNNGHSLLSYLRTTGESFAGQSAAAAGKLALGLAAAHEDPTDFAGLNLAISLTHYYNAATGVFGNNNSDQALAILGLAAARQPIPPAAVNRLAATANDDGGWGWATGIASDVDSTALAIEALIAAGEPPTATAIISGLAFLRDVQATNDDGGFAHGIDFVWGRESNTNSTAFAMQGIIAAGQDPLTGTWAISGSLPLDFLRGQQLADGAFVYVDPPADLFATQQAVPALLGKPFPLPSRAVALRDALAWTAAQQQPDGSFATGPFATGTTVDAVLAIAATGADPASFVSGAGNSPLDYLTGVAAGYAAGSTSAAGKLAVAVAAVGADPANFGGVDLVDRLQSAYQANGQYGGGSTWDQAWAMMGLAAARAEPGPAAVDYLESIRNAQGAWGFDPGAASADVDSTALALQALAAAGQDRDSAAVTSGLTFLHAAQNADGGFQGFGGVTSPSSTGLALQALHAFDENPIGVAWTRVVTDGSQSRLTVHTPLDQLLGSQSPAGGWAGFSGPDDPFSTYQAVPGIAGRPFPLTDIRTARYFPLAAGD